MKIQIYISSLIISLSMPLTVFAFDQSSPPNSLVVATDGKIGVGTDSPTSLLHAKKDEASIKVEDTSIAAGNRQLLELINNGGIGMRMNNVENGSIWDFNNTNNGNFTASKVGTGGFEFEVQGNGRTKIKSLGTLIMDMRANGDLHIPEGDIIVGGATLTVPDYVFEDDYSLMSLDELKVFITKNKHLPNVASEAEIKKSRRVSMAKSHMKHLEKIEELTLYTIEQHEQIKMLEKRLEDQNSAFLNRIASLEKLVTNIASSDKNQVSSKGEKVVSMK